MKKILSLSILICLLAFQPSAYASQEQLKQDKQYAAKLLDEGKNNEAYEAYSLLLLEEPTDLGINLGYARSALASNRLGQATIAYERLLTQYPNEPILLKELAYALAMQDDELRANMELAKNPNASSEENADLLASWTQEDKITHIKGSISAGFIYDSNVNAGPASREIRLGMWDVRLSEEAEQQDSFANYITANIDVAHKINEDSPWWLTAKMGLYARYNYASELNDMHLSSSEYATGTVGIRRLTNNTMFEMNLNAQVFDYDFYENTFAIGPEVNFVYALTPKIHLITTASLNHRAYSDNSLYNGWYSSLGQYARFFVGNAGHTITLGGRYINASANEDDYSYNGFEASVDFTFILPYNLRLSTYFAYGEEHFNGIATALEEDNRFDQRIRTGASLMIPLSEAWEIALGYQYTNNYSNSEIYSYDQHLSTVSITWKF